MISKNELKFPLRIGLGCGSVNDVCSKVIREIAPYCSRQPVFRPGCSDHCANNRYGTFRLDLQSNNRSRGHELKESGKEIFGRMLCIEYVNECTIHAEHAYIDDGQSLLLNAQDNGPEKMSLDSVRLDHKKRTFTCHENYLQNQNRCTGTNVNYFAYLVIVVFFDGGATISASLLVDLAGSAQTAII